LDARFHPAEQGDAAVLWVGGAGGGLDGPAWGLYPRLASQLAPEGTASLRLDYRYPNELVECTLDTLIGVLSLERRGLKRVALVGHSFGGAVVIMAGVASETVVGVAALSSQTFGSEDVHRLSPRALLVMHGEADEVLPAACGRSIYARAREPKKLILYPNCGHGLDACREQVDADLLTWLRDVLRA
ncbi:MAG: alpha/beta hydrolase, partial [Chloroflexi bacterium]|nr:alpha/beta hydrolase [Chloroflexota bacterium]